MCGIAGFVDLRPSRDSSTLESIGKAMGNQIAHRGPDDSGVWTDPYSGVCLSHRRLSIVDLSPAGHQPMTSQDGRYVMIFNGEIYNHKRLRNDLEARFGGIAWRGTSDTEVLLEGIARLGFTEALGKAEGMFALAAWDRAERRLMLARDRVGEKPLYYGLVGSTFIFASELKALQAHPDWRGELNTSIVPSYLRLGYVPAPHSIYRNIYKLEAGHFISAPAGELNQPQPLPYWRFPLPTSTRMDERNALDVLESTLRSAIGRQLEADVPVGCFLSGGVDSSLVTALAQSVSARPIRTYSIGFDDPDFNEAPFAAAIARHLRTEHTELYVDGPTAVAVVPQLSQIYDEPFADSSQIPTTLLSRLTRQHVTVALSGDAGDELFGGYDRYALLERVRWVFEQVPAPLRLAGAAALAGAPASAVLSFARLLPEIGPRLSVTRLERVASFLRYGTGYDAYKDLMSQFPAPSLVAPSLAEVDSKLDDKVFRRAIDGLPPWAAFIDALTYLPDDILVKVDRASMAASLETRVPMLDPEVIGCAAQFPWPLKRKDGISKWPLRALLARHVPRELFDRPKRGFGVPLGSWLREDLREWAEALLQPGVGLIPDILDAGAVGRLWRNHLSGRRDNKYRIWTLLMLQQWAVENRQAVEKRIAA